jgi:cytochrome c
MGTLEFNKIAGAILVAGIAYSGFGVIADHLVYTRHLEKSAIAVAGVAEPAAAPAAEKPKPLPPIAPLLASASASAGQADTKKLCVVCHNFAEGAGAKVGPDLYGVVGRERASAPGFTYSSALQGKPGKWTFETLNEWIHKPMAWAPGTKMAFVGIDDAKERADVIAYLDTLSPNPVPLPAAK